MSISLPNWRTWYKLMFLWQLLYNNQWFGSAIDNQTFSIREYTLTRSYDVPDDGFQVDWVVNIILLFGGVKSTHVDHLVEKWERTTVVRIFQRMTNHFISGYSGHKIYQSYWHKNATGQEHQPDSTEINQNIEELEKRMKWFSRKTRETNSTNYNYSLLNEEAISMRWSL